MENEIFDPSRHALSPDGNSWVLKGAETSFINPPYWNEDKAFYNELTDRMVASNPNLSHQQAIDKIAQVEKALNYRYVAIGYRGNIVSIRRRLLAFEAIGLLTDEEKKELDEIQNELNTAVGNIKKETDDSEEQIMKDLDSIITQGFANGLREASDILIDGPRISGFEEMGDHPMTNNTVRDFLQNTFGKEALRRAKLAEVAKDNKYLLNPNESDKKRQAEKIKKLHAEGLVTAFAGFLVADTRKKFIEASMVLEDVSEPKDLKYANQLVASAGNPFVFGRIDLRNFSLENSKDYDYLADTDLSEDDKIRAYILSTLAHEVAHRYEAQLPREKFDDYTIIMDSEISPDREKYVSDYVVTHANIYKSDEALILREDFAETVRIYTTNAKYLQTKYPRRFEFIQKNFPFIKTDTAVSAISPR